MNAEMIMNTEIFILVLMILGHLIADYPLQGWLAQSKTKSYWKDTHKMYKNDYIPAMLCHATMWTIVMMLPIMLFCFDGMNWLWLAVPINVTIHYIVDDLKANKKKLNLWQDQLLHLLQIVITWLVYILIL